MENNSSSRAPSVSAKDFFLHLGTMVALYTVTISFINLLFRVINRAFPEMITNSYYWSQGSEISMPVATLIIVFPIFVVLSRIVHRSYEVSPEKAELSIRKWLIYITLFLAGLFLVGDLVAVLYKFLDGQDLTVAFLLKALVVLFVSATIFGFYLKDIRSGVSDKHRKIWASAVGLVILLSIILGFSVLGSPQSQRLLRYDNQKISDLQNIQWQVINYWQVNGSIPETWENMMMDQETGEAYEYRKNGELSFELCASFNKMMQVQNSQIDPGMFRAEPYYKGSAMNEDWSHPAGFYCFSRTIDPIVYPTQVRG